MRRILNFSASLRMDSHFGVRVVSTGSDLTWMSVNAVLRRAGPDVPLVRRLVEEPEEVFEVLSFDVVKRERVPVSTAGGAFA